jgi:dipeptide/tripeptide permease
MDGRVGPFYILPDQIQVLNPALILLMIPIFEFLVYPVFNKCKIFLS